MTHQSYCQTFRAAYESIKDSLGYAELMDIGLQPKTLGFDADTIHVPRSTWLDKYTNPMHTSSYKDMNISVNNLIHNLSKGSQCDRGCPHVMIYVTDPVNNNTVVALGSLQLNIDGEPIGIITQVAVHPEWRGRRIAQMMVGCIVEVAQELGQEELTLMGLAEHVHTWTGCKFRPIHRISGTNQVAYHRHIKRIHLKGVDLVKMGMPSFAVAIS